MIIANAFSLNMLNAESAAKLAEGAQCAIGHTDTARLVAQQIAPERETEFVEAAKARPTVTLRKGDEIIVAQYRGPRLPEGATQLPEGAKIEYYLVEIS